jgi:anti-anti-sigma factor
MRESEEARKELEMKGHTLVLAGELDRVSAPVLETEIERLCEQGVVALTLDLRTLSEIDAVGVAVIVHRCGWCERRGCRMSLLADAGPVQSAFAKADASARVEFVQSTVTEVELPVGAQARQPVREHARIGRAQFVRRNRFALSGRAALAAAIGYPGSEEARASSLSLVSGRNDDEEATAWARPTVSA